MCSLLNYSANLIFFIASAIKQSLKRVETKPKSTLSLVEPSGKSSYAQQLAQENGGKVLYVATATAGDDEMKTRIENHRKKRPPEWRTLEAPLNVGKAIEQELAEHPADVILLDCMTLLATNAILQLPEDTSELQASEAVNKEVNALLVCMKKSDAQWIIVSNEVGWNGLTLSLGAHLP